MSGNLIDVRELDIYAQDLLDMGQKELPVMSKRFIKKEGKKLKSRTLKKAKAKVEKIKGNYYEGIKAGKVYKYRGNGGTSIRVYGGKPAYHAHLLEYGHRQVQNPPKKNGRGVVKGKGIGKEVGFVPGYHVFEESRNEFKDTFYKDIDGFLDEVVKKI